MTDTTVMDEINQFVESLKKHNIDIDKIILFGSYAKNTQHADSDIDLAVISESFGKDEIEEMMNMKKIAIRISDRISPIPLNNNYMQMKYHPLIGEIKKYGKVVFS